MLISELKRCWCWSQTSRFPVSSLYVCGIDLLV